ncbi:MAG: hypothetical protein WA888_22295 [Burkholderiaceae bacterium]
MNHSTFTEQAIAQITAAAQANLPLIRRGRFVSCDMMLTVGDKQWLFSITQGRINSVIAGPLVMPSYTFDVSAPESEWHQFWAPTPPPGSQDLFALLKRRVLKLNGNLHPLMSNLFYFKFLLAAPRELNQ